ncbi:GH11525 [Drosophila grimshawi]|uniref:GH11525 n=2 Tax=Drosophila grimshawi TaxID=7222 RepID=B4JB57_DROGR|nr:GH11525 [Drosophila grimshawi]
MHGEKQYNNNNNNNNNNTRSSQKHEEHYAEQSQVNTQVNQKHAPKLSVHRNKVHRLEGSKEVMQKSTQTCMLRTQPESLHKMRLPKQQQQKPPITKTYMVSRPAQPVQPNRGQFKSTFNVDCVSGLPSEDCLIESKFAKPELDASGDCVRYINPNYGKDSSKTMLSEVYEGMRKRSASPLETTSEHCNQINARLDALLAEDSESVNIANSMRMVIAGKSGTDLRAVVRSQIQMQHELTQSISKIAKSTERLVMGSNPQKMPSQKAMDNLDVNNALVTAKDVISLKVMAPIMRRVQRLYYNNLQEKIEILNDMERASELVDEIYESFNVQRNAK